MDPVTPGGGGASYADSVDSSPRSRGGESWDEPPFPSSSLKLRLMCSYGGRIVPRPTDKSLCYLGGETRIVAVDRTSSLADLSAKLSRNLLGGRPFSLKYQLPNEDLDSLISVTTDEDLDNMIEEYERIAAANPAANTGPTKRVRLFLFPSKPESAPSSIGSLLDDSKSETWFVDALNGAMGMGIDGFPRGMSTDSASVNCLLGLEDDSSSVHSRAGAGAGNGGGGGSSQVEPDRVIINRPVTRQDAHSVPDSPMLENSSSFGSTSSAPALSNLPPIRVRLEDRPPDPRYANIDEHFAQMNLTSANIAAVQRQEDIPKASSAPPTIPLPNVSAPNPNISPTENPRPGVLGSEEERADTRKPPLSSPPHPKPVPVESPMQDRPVYYQERIPATVVAAGNPIPDLKREIPVSATGYRMQQVPEPGYVLPTAHTQQQFIQTNPRYVQVPSYYQVPHPMQQPPQQLDQQMPMYYLPVRQTPQPQPATAVVPMSKLPQKADMQPNIYRTMAPPPAQMVHMAPDQSQMYNAMGYHLVHQQASQPMAPNYGYEYTNAVAAPDSVQPQQQMYYAQATLPPSSMPMPVPVQYQAVQDDAKQNRGS